MTNRTNDGVRWMVSFWHLDGDFTTEPNFPKVDFWHPDKQTSRREGARVLWELRERGDTREWVAAGHPDPLRVPGMWYNPGANWTLRSSDIVSDGKGGGKIRSVAGIGRDNPVWEELANDIAERRAAAEAKWTAR